MKACACGSGAGDAECCRPLLRGVREAADAVALMRSRYTAFSLGDVEYLWRTLHESHADRQRPRDDVVRSLRDTCRRVRFMGLAILDSSEAGLTAAGGNGDGYARVLFSVRAFEKGRSVSFHELSRFLHDGTGWRYVDGRIADGEAQPGLRIATAFAPR